MFFSLFTNIALMLVYMLIGFLLCKSKLSPVSHAKGMSALLLYVLNPAMLINSFLSVEYTHETFKKILVFFFLTLIVQLTFILMLYFVLRKKYEDPKYRILTVGSVLGNVGYMGLPVLVGLFPNEPIVMCYSSINVMSMNLIVFTMGVFLITNDRKYISVKSALLNPTSIAILFSLPLFFLNVSFPDPIANSISLLGKMVTPMCMFILGMRLSAAKLKEVFTRSFVYITCLFKLVIYPSFAFLLVHFLPFIDDITKASVIVLSAVPSGAVIGSLAELHECEQELAANVVFLTTIISVITIPIVTTILLGI